MISIVIDANIIFSALYNKKGLERTIINLILEKNEMQLFAPVIFREEITRNLENKLGFNRKTIETNLNYFDIIEIPYQNYNVKLSQAGKLVAHQNDIPYIAVALLINGIIWSGNIKHFRHLKSSKEVIWFNTRNLFNYLKRKNIK
ncbi:unnamed protein product [marine sediment metagenome]|uniref:PIN domain-containing protein n=1 Tax=marine sediment metagenome TaxID=412755 RepID=X0YI93_9ZZZZ